MLWGKVFWRLSILDGECFRGRAVLGRVGGVWFREVSKNKAKKSAGFVRTVYICMQYKILKCDGRI